MKPPAHIGVVILCGPDPARAGAARAALAEAGHREGLVWAVLPPGGAPSGGLGDAFGDGRLLTPPEGEGLSARCNRGVRAALRAGADYVLLLADTCRPAPGSLSRLQIALEAQRHGGVACPALVDGEDGRLVGWGGRFLPVWGRAEGHLRGLEAGVLSDRRWEEVDFAPAACALYKRELFEDVGLFHEAFGGSSFDVEFGLRARREAWIALAVPHARATVTRTPPDRRDPQEALERARNPLWLQRGWGRPLVRLGTLPLMMAGSWPAAFLAHLFTGRFRCAGAVVRGSLTGLFGRGWREGGHLSVPLEGHRAHIAVPSAVREMARYL